MFAPPQEQLSSGSGGLFMRLRCCLQDMLCKKTRLVDFAIISALCGGLKQAWCDAAFSPMQDHAFKRYLNFQLECIQETLDTIPFSALPAAQLAAENEMIGLIDYLFSYFKASIDSTLYAPAIYRNYQLGSLTKSIEELSNKLESHFVDNELKAIINYYISEMSETAGNIHDTYHSLFYFEKFVRQISALDYLSKDVNTLLVLKITALNFNHLAFITYLKRMYAEKDFNGEIVATGDFGKLKTTILFLSPVPETRYDIELPGLETLVITGDPLKLAQPQPGSPAGKINLDLSVAQLALILRLFFEENLLARNPLKHIFKTVSTTFRTKRQSQISSSSLSKEYYSIDQVTAAVVRNILQKMIIRINHTFFPVWVAAISTILYSVNNH